ncbi:MAG: winged helix-turn-helix transcriptional regulator [Clostridia bacterium]|nr:winged helix-turn-helix transcriptional regulator [Clostridia bacterium]
MGIQNILKALADPTRREILEMLKKSRLSAGEIAECFTMSAPAVSKHLNILKEADLIRDSREGKYIFYELNASVLEEVMLWMAELKGEKDGERVQNSVYTDSCVDSDNKCSAGSVT